MPDRTRHPQPTATVQHVVHMGSHRASAVAVTSNPDVTWVDARKPVLLEADLHSIHRPDDVHERCQRMKTHFITGTPLGGDERVPRGGRVDSGSAEEAGTA